MEADGGRDDARTHARPDRRAVLRLRAAVRRRQRAGPARHRRTRSGCTAACSTAPASRSPTRCSSCGRPTPTAWSSSEPGSLRRDGYTFTGWGRAATDSDGRYSFTDAGAPVPGAAPFFAVTVFARGLLNRLFTRAYLPGQRALAPTGCCLAGPRAATLVAPRTSTGFVFDIRLQGDDETVFLSYPRRLTHERISSGPATSAPATLLDATARLPSSGVARGRGGRLGSADRARPGRLAERLDAATRRGAAATRSSRWWRCCATARHAPGGRTLAAPRPDQPGRRSTPR